MSLTRLKYAVQRLPWLGLALGLLGCQRGPLVRFSSADQIIARVFERTSCSCAVVGDARIQVAGPFAHYEGKVLLKAEAPARLRFDLYSDFGVSLAALATDERQFSFFDLGSNTFITGEPRACNLARFTQVQVPPLALVELLRGRPPVLEHKSTDAQLRWSNPWFQDGRYVVTVEGDHESREKLWISVPEQDWSLPVDKQRAYLTKINVEQGGRSSYSVELGDYRPVNRADLEPTPEERQMGIVSHEPTGPDCSAELPHSLTFDVGHGGHELRILAAELSHNPPRVSGSYQLEQPRGANLERSDCR